MQGIFFSTKSMIWIGALSALFSLSASAIEPFTPPAPGALTNEYVKVKLDQGKGLLKAAANAVCSITGQAASVNSEVCWVDSLQTHEISTNTISLDGGIEIPFHIRISPDGSGAIATIDGNEVHAGGKLVATLAPTSLAINPVIVNPVYGCKPGTGERFFKSGELKISSPGASLNLTLGVTLTSTASASTGFIVTGLGFTANFDNNISTNLSYGDITIDLANGQAWGLPPEPTFSQVSMVYDALIHSLIQRITKKANENISNVMLTAADGIIITFKNGVDQVSKKVDQIAAIPPAQNGWSKMLYKTMINVGLNNVPVCGPSLNTFFNFGSGLGTFSTPGPTPPSPMNPMAPQAGSSMTPTSSIPQPRQSQTLSPSPIQVQGFVENNLNAAEKANSEME